jgi:hypothetical protein
MSYSVNQVLVVLVNGDAVCAYPIESGDAAQISVIREKVQEKVAEYNKANPVRFEEDKLKVRCQIVGVDMPACSPDGFIASLFNDIIDRVST